MNDRSDRPTQQQQEQAKMSLPPRYGRAQHRARQHESAHADEASHAPSQPVIEHPLVPRGAGELITTQAALEEFLAHLRSAKSFAYDSEFIGELSYHPRLC